MRGAATAALHSPCCAGLARPAQPPHAASAAIDAAGATAAPGGIKWVHLVRHGETEMNVALGRLPPGARYGEPAFVDPHFPDTRLTERGRQQAAVASAAAAALAPPPQLLVVSPLTRALQTAELAFATFGSALPRVAHHHAAERLYLFSDVGRPREQLEAEYPGYCFKELPSSSCSGDSGSGSVWWHSGEHEAEAPGEAWPLEGEDELQLIDAHEPAAAFLRRVERLRQWLEARPESSLALVSHWGVLHALTGDEFANCEVRTLRLGDLRARPHLLRPRQAAGRPL
ncbi:phosphoglycerate mutase [Micractinium conductrix]|uniref:Phosphoglycerate mutase n=1 Tax=Micractinium conductrix TaxID=554055 RepID=A0A2P6VSH8_9CHLO|nr:phosphoglycerate mutase [Micractinium conductrix]|eukprot:PSC77039.1 phosphoglycerate mutase [Micractinium conductrix]